MADNGNNDQDENKGPPKTVLLALKGFIGFIFFILFLASSVFSKLSLLSLTGSLRHNYSFVREGYDRLLDDSLLADNDAITIYWQLLIVLVVPSLFTFLRCLFFGFLGKTRKNFPWPCKGAVLAVRFYLICLLSLVKYSPSFKHVKFL